MKHIDRGLYRYLANPSYYYKTYWIILDKNVKLFHHLNHPTQGLVHSVKTQYDLVFYTEKLTNLITGEQNEDCIFLEE